MLIERSARFVLRCLDFRRTCGALVNFSMKLRTRFTSNAEKMNASISALKVHIYPRLVNVYYVCPGIDFYLHFLTLQIVLYWIHTCATSSSNCYKHLNSPYNPSSFFLSSSVCGLNSLGKKWNKKQTQTAEVSIFRKCSRILVWNFACTDTQIDSVLVGLWTIFTTFCFSKVGRWPCFSPGSDVALSEMFTLDTDEISDCTNMLLLVGKTTAVFSAFHCTNHPFFCMLHVHDPKILQTSHSIWKTSSSFIFLWIFCSHSCYCKHPLSSFRERGEKIKTNTKCWWKYLKMSNPSWYGAKKDLIMMFEPFSAWSPPVQTVS